MATPYLQLRREEVPSTQDIAREELDEIPVLVMATAQTEGRGRSGSEWLNAPRALAASLAFHPARGDRRPFSLMAGVAVCRAVGADCRLKWPNDVMLAERKVGGILVEQSEGVAVIGVGLNLWWPESPEGLGALFDQDPGADRHAALAGLWGAEMMRLLDGAGWPLGEYRDMCSTLGRKVAWEPDGAGHAVDVGEDGSLIVEGPDGLHSIYSGAVRHVRG